MSLPGVVLLNHSAPTPGGMLGTCLEAGQLRTCLIPPEREGDLGNVEVNSIVMSKRLLVR